jgi:hypothetical protein
MFRLDGFNLEELSVALTLHGRCTAGIPPRLLSRLSNPRIFALAMRLFKTSHQETDLGVDRLLFSYWDQRRLDRVDLRQIDPGGQNFYEGLARHAEIFHQQRLIVARDTNVDIGANEVYFADDELRQRFTGLQRYGDLSKEQVAALVGEIRDGQFFRSDSSFLAPAYVFQSSALGFALGLYLVQEALRILRAAKKGIERETLREHFAVLLEPVIAFDQTADQLLAAVTVACLESSTPAIIRECLIEQFICLQNRPELLRREFQGLGPQAPRAFFSVVDEQLMTTEAERLDTWLVDALRNAYREKSALDLFLEWIVSPPQLYARCFHYEPIEPAERAYRREVSIARIITGLPLAPLAEGLLDWALLATLRIRDDANCAGSALAPHPGGVLDRSVSPLASSPIAQVIRFNDADPLELEQEIIKLCAKVESEQDADRAKAVALLLAVIASPSALNEANRLWPTIENLIDSANVLPLAPIYLAVDPQCYQSQIESPRVSNVATTIDVVDPRSPGGEQKLVLAARWDQDAYVELARASLSALGEGGAKLEYFDEPFESLETLAIGAPSIFALRGDDDARFVNSLITLACQSSFADSLKRPGRSGKDLLKTLDHILEVLFANRPIDRYREILLAIPWDILPSDHWPARSHRWRPQLPATLVDELVDEVVAHLQSSIDEDNIVGANLLEAVALHPIETLSDATITKLMKLFLVRDQMQSCRQNIIAVAEAAGDNKFALMIHEAGWTVDSEADRNVAVAASRMLCSKLAGYLPIAELSSIVLPAALPTAARGVANDELISLAHLLHAAVTTGVELSAKASTEPEGPANLEKNGYIFRMLPFDQQGASRLLECCDDWAAACFALLSKEVVESPRNSLCESFGTSLAIAASRPIENAADYVDRLVRRRGTPNRPHSARILRAVLAVATAQPARTQGLLDLLVLSTNNDSGLARLVAAAYELGDETMSMVETYADALLESGRTMRMAYGLTLAGLLSHLSLRLGSKHADQCGYLTRVNQNAEWTARWNAASRHWAELRIATGDLAAEHLALSLPSKPLATMGLADTDSTEPLANVLFRHRIREKSEFDANDGLFGLLKPPNWIFERRV